MLLIILILVPRCKRSQAAMSNIDGKPAIKHRVRLEMVNLGRSRFAGLFQRGSKDFLRRAAGLSMILLRLVSKCLSGSLTVCVVVAQSGCTPRFGLAHELKRRRISLKSTLGFAVPQRVAMALLHSEPCVASKRDYAIYALSLAKFQTLGSEFKSSKSPQFQKF